ncbi:MAG: cystathionine gamma-synthase [Planctomycetes bacterium]|nr:cystathionine gamma-synthase [Planctomycetota bacterium]
MTKHASEHAFATRCVHAGQAPDPATGAIMTPVYMTSTYVQEAPAQHKGFDYSRTTNPTRTALEGNLAALEGGTYGLAFSSGMGAINTVLNLLQSGDHVVAGNDLYGGTYRILKTLYEKLGVTSTFVDTTNVAHIEAAIRPTTKLLMFETPTNPLLRLTDLEAASAVARKRGILTVCDNTFATPALQNPLALGCDLVVHSTTKYLGGHSDVVGGALIVNNTELYQKLKHFQNAVGATPGPMDCFLVLRGTKTLHLRMERHVTNAQRIAEYLAGHRSVDRVFYPGLTSHPQHALAKRQMRGAGGMVSFELKGGVEEGKRFASKTRLFALAESLGGVESLIDHPVSMTHGSIPREERMKAGLNDGLLRLSVGVEDVNDLIADLEQAFAAIR